MNLTIQREILLKPLNAVVGVVERRQTLPILANVHLTVNGNELEVTATDLEVELRSRITLDNPVSEAAEITVPARKLVDIINKPTRIMLGDVLRHLSIKIENTRVDKMRILSGGPIAQEQGFIITPKHFIIDNPITENAEVTVSTSKILLQSFAQGEGPKDILVTLGYCGWSAGQLENEIVNNDWLVAPYNGNILFHTPFDQRWRSGAASIGVDITKLCFYAGHA